MKKIILVLLFSTSLFSCENNEVEKSIWNSQIGSGIWINYEAKISKKITIKPEVGLINAYNYSSDDSFQFGLIPDINFEVRKYFNLNKRYKLGKETINNSANFWALQTRYLSKRFIFKSTEELEINNKLQLFVNWGIRRNLNRKFHYEAGLGFGKNFYTSEKTNNDNDDIVAKVHLRIGINL